MEDDKYDRYDDFNLNSKNHNNKSINTNKTKSKENTKNNNNIYSSKHVRIQSKKIESSKKNKK